MDLAARNRKNSVKSLPMAENATRTLADLKDLAQTAAPEPEIARQRRSSMRRVGRTPRAGARRRYACGSSRAAAGAR